MIRDLLLAAFSLLGAGALGLAVTLLVIYCRAGTVQRDP